MARFRCRKGRNFIKKPESGKESRTGLQTVRNLKGLIAFKIFIFLNKQIVQV